MTIGGYLLWPALGLAVISGLKQIRACSSLEDALEQSRAVRREQARRAST